jgi:hypothetical protein
MGFFRALWALARMTWPFVGGGQYFRNAGTLWAFLFFLFCFVFGIAWLFGYPPTTVGGWIDAHGGLWDQIGGWLWRLFWGVVLLICAISIFGIGADLFGKPATDAKDVPRDYRRSGCLFLGIVFVVVIACVAIRLPIE